MKPLPENDLDSFFDESKEQSKRNDELFLKNNHLLHKVFMQNESGKELLAKWKESLMMTPSLEGQSTQFEAGLNEGEKRFIRNLIVAIQTVENDYE